MTWSTSQAMISLQPTRPRGLPIGNLTSQFWANCYLNEFDHFVTRQLGCRAYLRYVDDFLLFADDKATLWRWRTALIERLAALRLTLHESRALVRPVTEGIPFLGFTVYPTHRLLKRTRGIAYRRRLRNVAARLPAKTDVARRRKRLRSGLDQPCALRRHMGLAHRCPGRGCVVKQSGEMPIFVKTSDFLAWLIPLSNHFPRVHRHTVTRRLLDAAFDFLERLLEANQARGSARLEQLLAADAQLDKVRLYLRLVYRWQWISAGQYEHAARLVAELGRLLGAWQKTTRQSPVHGTGAAGTG